MSSSYSSRPRRWGASPPKTSSPAGWERLATPAFQRAGGYAPRRRDGPRAAWRGAGRSAFQRLLPRLKAKVSAKTSCEWPMPLQTTSRAARVALPTRSAGASAIAADLRQAGGRPSLVACRSRGTATRPSTSSAETSRSPARRTRRRPPSSSPPVSCIPSRSYSDRVRVRTCLGRLPPSGGSSGALQERDRRGQFSIPRERQTMRVVQGLQLTEGSLPRPSFAFNQIAKFERSTSSKTLPPWQPGRNSAQSLPPKSASSPGLAVFGCPKRGACREEGCPPGPGQTWRSS